MDNESTLSFWNVFFDNIYKYSDELSDIEKDDFVNFISNYGRRSTFPAIEYKYNEIIKNNPINLSSKDSLIEWGINIYNSILKSLGCKENCNNNVNDNNIIFKNFDGYSFTPINLKMAKEWNEYGRCGVPRIKSYKREIDEKVFRFTDRIKTQMKISRRKKYIYISIFFILGFTAGIITFKYFKKRKKSK